MRRRMGTLLLIRHGQASYGEVDYDRLSTRGQEQARALGTYLGTASLDQLYVGPLVRQQGTAALAAEAAGNLPAPTTLAELAEYPAFDLLQHFMPKLVAADPKFAALTQTPTRELANEAFHTILGRWARDEWEVEGVERVTAFADRVRRGLDQIVRDVRSGARIAVVTSAGPIGVAVGLTFGASEHHMIRTSIVIRNASITELRFRSRDFDWHPERVSLIGFNSTHHLPTELHTEY
jgi:broad specificity phosphatase PhoE